jgi:hypothetical protein
MSSGMKGVLGDFMKEVDRSTRAGMLFRGVSCFEKHRLLPSVGRFLSTYERANHLGLERLLGDERDALQEFAEKCPRYYAAEFADEFELMFLAQHHGLPTRMLDWTFNPLVALFFAVWNDNDADGAVFVLAESRTAIGWRHLEPALRSPFELSGPTGLMPRHIDERVTAQDSVVIIHDDPTKEFWSPSLAPILIKADTKIELQASLRRCGVHHQSMFPGLDGLARRIANRSFTTSDAIDMWTRNGWLKDKELVADAMRDVDDGAPRGPAAS